MASRIRVESGNLFVHHLESMTQDVSQFVIPAAVGVEHVSILFQLFEDSLVDDACGRRMVFGGPQE